MAKVFEVEMVKYSTVTKVKIFAPNITRALVKAHMIAKKKWADGVTGVVQLFDNVEQG